MAVVTNSTSAFYQRSLGQFADLRSVAEDLQQQIATGERLTRSSDDPVASSRLRALSRVERLAEIDRANAARTSEELSAASSSTNMVADLVIRARELALWSANDTTTQSERELIAAEIDQLREALFASANELSSTGRALFGGDTNGAAYEQDAAGNVTYIGSTGSGEIDIGAGIEVERGLTGPAVFAFQGASGPTDVFAFLAALSDEMRNGVDPAGFSRSSLSGFDAAIDQLGRAQAIFGARIAWIDTVQQTQTLQTESRAEEAGELGATNLAEAIARLQQTLTVLEASQTSFTRVSSLTLFDAI